MDIDALFKKVTLADARKGILQENIKQVREKRDNAKTQAENAMLARQLVIEIAKKTQLNIGNRISDLVSLALAAVFEDPYAFKIEFVERRGATEADLLFERNGFSLDPMTASGGGAIDIASFSLRLAVSTLGTGRKLFVLDEPFRNLSLDLQAKAGLMLQELASKLGIQIVMVSHNPEIISGADKVFSLSGGGKRG